MSWISKKPTVETVTVEIEHTQGLGTGALKALEANITQFEAPGSKAEAHTYSAYWYITVKVAIEGDNLERLKGLLEEFMRQHPDIDLRATGNSIRLGVDNDG